MQLQICLYHVLRTFGREFTTKKMNISAGERDAVLEHVTKLAYCQTDEEYDTAHIAFLRSTASHAVRKYYQEQSHTIKEQWVTAFTKRKLNLGETTTNRVESFFGKLKDLLDRRLTIEEMISDILTFIETLRHEKKLKAIRLATTVSTKCDTEVGQEYKAVITEYAYNI